MIRPDALGDLKDGAAGLVALSELLASRRVGPKAVAAALPAASEACTEALRATSAASADVLSACGEEPLARSEVRTIFERAAESLRALESEVTAASGSPGDAKTRLVLERATNAASASVGTCLFVAELFSFAEAPRVVSVHVADVLAFGPSIPEGPGVVRATLDAPSGPVATTDPRLLRALVELGVQIVASAGVTAPHVHVSSTDREGARIRIGPAPTPLPPSSKSASQRRSARPSAPVAQVSVRSLPWGGSASILARTAASLAGADVVIDPNGRGVTIAI